MRLSPSTLDRLPRDVARYDYDRAEQKIGIVHLGLGAFHRAHQAVFTDKAMAGGDRDWGIAGASLRSPAVRAQLAPQGGLFSVTEKMPGAERTRVIGAILDVMAVSGGADNLCTALASPDVAVVTLTVTEKGYHRRADGAPDIDAVARASNTIYHHLARAFADRQRSGASGLTLLSCDNLTDNGGALEAGLKAWLDRTDPALGRWFAAECSCPSSMVDRIVPATRSSDLDEVAARLGMEDAAAVVTEPFAQWVIEDRFTGRRPRWDIAGATFTSNVAPYETAKLRMLNGAHSALAYLGLQAKHRFVHQAIADPAIRPTVERLMRQEAARGFDPAPGQDLGAYADTLLARFANAALPHALSQIAADGSQKIPQRWLASLADNAARGNACPATLAALAGWVRFVRGDLHPVEDPNVAALATEWSRAGRDGIIDALFGDDGFFAGAWRPSPTDRQALTHALRHEI